MAPIKTILSPVDFSETSAAALRQAETLAHDLGAQLVLVHVVDDAAFGFPEQGDLTSRIVEEYVSAMKAKLSDLARGMRSDLKIGAKTVSGAPHQAILDAAKQEHADLVVMGTHGRTGVGHLLLGSVAERVVRLARVPVLTVRG